MEVCSHCDDCGEADEEGQVSLDNVEDDVKLDICRRIAFLRLEWHFHSKQRRLIIFIVAEPVRFQPDVCVIYCLQANILHRFVKGILPNDT